MAPKRADVEAVVAKKLVEVALVVVPVIAVNLVVEATPVSVRVRTSVSGDCATASVCTMKSNLPMVLAPVRVKMMPAPFEALVLVTAKPIPVEDPLRELVF